MFLTAAEELGCSSTVSLPFIYEYVDIRCPLLLPIFIHAFVRSVNVYQKFEGKFIEIKFMGITLGCKLSALA